MKNSVIILLVLIMFACNMQDKQEVVEPQTDPIPKATLFGYPVDKGEFVEAFFEKTDEEKWNFSVAQVIIEAEQKIKIEKGGYTYNLNLLSSLVGLKLGNEISFFKGAILLNADELQMKVIPFKVKKFKTEWEYTELLPISKKYPLSVMEGGEIMFGYDHIKEYYGPGTMFEVLDAPKHLVEFGSGEFYLTNSKNKLWGENPNWDK